jgi:hypothetical protein
MYNVEDIYGMFRAAQGRYHNRGYRLPKDFEKHFTTRMSASNTDNLILITKYFNTKWSNLDPDLYFDYGCELYKTFSYNLFFNENILKYYIRKDKNKKREMDVSKQTILKSTKFVKSYIKKYKIQDIKQYCRLRDNNESIIIQHYVKGYIDKIFLSLMIQLRFVILDDNDRAQIPYINEHYRKCCVVLNDMRDFISKLKRKL